MKTQFSQDVVSLAELQASPAKVVRRAHDTHRPTLLTNRGRGVAVLQSLGDYEYAARELRFMKAVVRGMADAGEGRTVALDKARDILGVG